MRVLARLWNLRRYLSLAIWLTTMLLWLGTFWVRVEWWFPQVDAVPPGTGKMRSALVFNIGMVEYVKNHPVAEGGWRSDYGYDVYSPPYDEGVGAGSRVLIRRCSKLAGIPTLCFTFWERRGFVNVLDGESQYLDFEKHSLPLWLLPLAATLPLVPRLWRWRLRRHWLSHGCCGGCGYDIRANTGRCSECGLPISAPPSPKPWKCRRVIWAIGVFAATVIIAIFCAWAWLWSGWYREKAWLDAVSAFPVTPETWEGDGSEKCFYKIGPDWLDTAMGAFRYQRHRFQTLTFPDDFRSIDSALHAMAGLHYVRSVSLESSWICDTDILQCLAEPDRVEEIDLGEGRGLMQCLRHTPNLKVLQAHRATDAEIRNLRFVPRLVRLYLCGSAITDAGLDDVVALESLEALDLQGADVSANAAQRVLRLKHLRALWLPGAWKTEATKAKLRADLPGVELDPLWSFDNWPHATSTSPTSAQH